jgi:energy-converting hydrogenase A subunit D
MIMIDFPYAAVVLMIVGAVGGLLQTRPIDKILMLAVLGDGTIGLIATYQYLDVAMASSFMTFVSIIILMIGLIRTREIKKAQGELP